MPRFYTGLLAFTLLSSGSLWGQPNITQVEYYLDNDPGLGKAISATINSGKQVSSTFSLNIGTLSAGLHIVGVRSRDASGAWSLDERWLFLKSAAIAVAPATPNITYAEWFVDNDPGLGRATAINLTPAKELNNISFSFNDVAGLSPGLHSINVRSKDAHGAWSLVERWLFLKSTSPGTLLPTPNITYAEWFIDTDPGYGAAFPLTLTPGNEITNISFSFNDLEGLSRGLHTLNVRCRDANGAWSLDERWLFMLPFPVSAISTAQVTQMEYYIDNDPGYGKAIPVAFLPKSQMTNTPFFVNITGLNSGKHMVYFRSKDNKGAWSFDDSLVLNIGSLASTPAIVVNSVEITSICKGMQFRVGYHATGTYNNGNQFIAEMSDQNGSFDQPFILGVKNSRESGLMQVALGNDAENGGNFRIRLRSTNPAVTGVTGEQHIAIKRYYIGRDTTAFVVCSNQRANITSIFNPDSTSITYSIGNPNNAVIGLYSVFAVSASGCRDTAKVSVQQDVALWTGSINTDWHNPGNWNTGRVPNGTTHVIIPANTLQICRIEVADGVAASVQVLTDNPSLGLQIQSGRTLNIVAKCGTLPL